MAKGPRAVNPMGRSIPADKAETEAYMAYQTLDGSWTWYVLKTYQTPEKEATNPYARWYCKVVSPFTPEGEIGDVYVSEIKANARRIK